MSGTSGEAIKQAILAIMAGYPDDFDVEHPRLRLLVECIARGVYAELTKLQDVGGTIEQPNATSHR